MTIRDSKIKINKRKKKTFRDFERQKNNSMSK